MRYSARSLPRASTTAHGPTPPQLLLLRATTASFMRLTGGGGCETEELSKMVA